MAISAHGFVLTHNEEVVPDLGDVMPPMLSRKSVEDTRHPSIDDAYEVGIARYGHLVFDVASTADAIDRFGGAWLAHALGHYTLTFADNAMWTFLGYVIDVSPKAPADGALMARVTVQVSGGIVIGAAEHQSSLLLETGDYILLETGDTILLEN